MFTHEYFMRQALAQANQAFDAGEVPVGAVIVHGNHILAKAHNQVELLRDSTAHAEILALTAAMQQVGGKYLPQCTLYVTLEPCPMCAGALYWAQMDTVLYAATDTKRGFSLFNPPLLHPSTKVENGILAQPCAHLLQRFFKNKRNSNK